MATAYTCEVCNYSTLYKGNFSRHCQSLKHMANTNQHVHERFRCGVCNRHYKNRSGLYKHMKQKHEKIQLAIEGKSTEVETLTNLVHTLITENKDLQDKLVEIASIPRIIHHTTNTNSNNKTYNIINYLNTECKDAFNLSDFVKDLTITFDDIKDVKEIGYVSSIKNTFIKSLHDVEQNKRPIHCTDRKRKQFYVKEKNEWFKDNLNTKARETIEKINNKQLSALENWKNNHPNWQQCDQKFDKICDIQRTLLSMYSAKDKKEKVVNKILTNLTELEFDSNAITNS